MIFDIDTHSGIPIYRQIMDQLRRQILTGRLAEGEQVESVRALGARLKINPMTISKAYGLLERDDLLERRRGVGLFVAPIRKEREQRMKREAVDDLVRRTAATAAQMGVDEEEVREMLTKHFRKQQTKKGRGRS